MMGATAATTHMADRTGAAGGTTAGVTAADCSTGRVSGTTTVMAATTVLVWCAQPVALATSWPHVTVRHMARAAVHQVGVWCPSTALRPEGGIIGAATTPVWTAAWRTRCSWGVPPTSSCGGMAQPGPLCWRRLCPAGGAVMTGTMAGGGRACRPLTVRASVCPAPLARHPMQTSLVVVGGAGVAVSVNG